MFKKISKIDLITIFFIIFALISYISLIFNDSLWGDEAFTMLLLKNNFADIITLTAEDVHPPLYYFIAKIFTMIFGYNVPAVKLASIVPVILLMLFVKIKSNKLFEKNPKLISLIFILLVGFCPQAFIMNVELRMYTWAMLFVTCSGIYAYELYKYPKNKKTICLFILSSLAAAYTHYYALLTVCFIYLFLLATLLDKKEYKTSLFIVIVTILGYIPWLPIFIQQFFTVSSDWWLLSFGSTSLLSFIEYLFLYSEFKNIFLILFMVSAVELILYIKNNNKDNDSWFALLCILSLVLTICIGIILSYLIRPIYVDRYIYTGAGLLFLGISIAICKSNYKNLLKSFLVGLIILNIPFEYDYIHSREYNDGTEKVKEFFVEENLYAKNVKISTDIYHFSWTILPYYLPNADISDTIDENTTGYIFTNKSKDKLKEMFPNIEEEPLFIGNIDSTYTFAVYYIDN